MKLNSMTLTLLAATTLLAGLASSLWLGAGQSPDWLPAGKPAALPTAAKPAPVATLPEQSLALVWQQSMFSPDRKPDPIIGKRQSSSLAGIRLTGVVMDAQAQWALLRLPDKRSLKLAVGKDLDNGWTLSAVTPQQATFTHQGQTQRLSLPVLRLPPPSKAPLITLPDVPTP